MDYLESLRVFRSVVEAKSFTRAADMLGVTAPVVSRAIAGLEQRLGSRLFHRTTRQVSLTEAGEHFYEGCSRILDDLEELEAQASKQTREASGVLRLVAHTTSTVNRLVPLISTFKRKHPKVSLDVTLTERPVDLVADGYDLGVVVPFMLNSDTTVTRLLERIPLCIAAAPQYLQTHARPLHPSELAEHTFVVMSPSLRKPFLTFRVGQEDLTIPMTYDIASNNPVFNREMVLQGFGIGVVPVALAQKELASGQLVSLLDEFEIVDGAIEIRLAYSTRTLLPAKVRAFIEHAAAFFEEVSGTPAALEPEI
ncbi:HTH-type transcriptional regulator PgrR (plasmid) [Caballeronia sp. SBC1]|uniref:LysR family transcriptional regulator n=1 Tax=unclassified Caballeronia TaxID=2646786 RepID=UPI0013E1FB81|nr:MULTISPECIES: LysR family transcriptional regulator [unclassified Caballeronia]QIE28107.1 HTH-type transcriptional regulator PgrR [Caballeronia sp. SBC2]QIN66169.1 HTH-type transcriptional regulator PgrR [Caballeronia sp. SBC1]